MKIQNYNEDFERTVLSAIIYEPEIIEDILQFGLTKEDFYHPFHQKLFSAMEYLYEHSAIEEGIIKEYMGSSFDEVQMLDVLASLPVTNIIFYAEKIQEYARVRHFKQLGYQILKGIEEENSLSDTLHLVHEELEKIEDGSKDLFKIVSLVDIQSSEAEFVCKSWLPFPKSAVSMVTAGGGVGKSFLLLQAAMRMVRDEQLKVFMWLSEDPLSLSKYRFDMISKQLLKSDLSVFSNHLHLSGADSETIHFLEESRGGSYSK